MIKIIWTAKDVEEAEQELFNKMNESFDRIFIESIINEILELARREVNYKSNSRHLQST